MSTEDSTPDATEPRDEFGCSAAIDFRVQGQGPVLLTRCSRRFGHEGKHNNPRTKSWQDSETTWVVSPPVLDSGGVA